MAAKFLKHNFPLALLWKKWSDGHRGVYRLKSTTTAHQGQTTNVDTSQPNIKCLSNKESEIQQPLPFSSMPGPRGLRTLPYIGAAFMFKPFTKFTPYTFGKLISHMHDKYGPVFKARMGKDYSVHTDSVHDVETVFRNEGQYPHRRHMTLSKVFIERNGLPYTIGTVSGPEWQELRSPLNTLLNRPQVCLHYLPAQNQVADDFVGRLRTNIFNPEQLSEEFFKFSAESIGVICFNERLGFFNSDLSTSPDRLRLLEAYKTIIHSTFKSIMGLERNYLKTADDPFYREFEDAMTFIRKQSMVYVEKIVHELNSRNSQGVQHSHTENNKSNPESNLLASIIVNGKLDIQRIMAVIDSMLIAGTDSTARNLSVLLYNLAVNPQAQINAAKEVIDLIGPHGPITAEALAKMNYLKSCVKESMRINFPVTSGTERILPSDTVLSGYLVPKGTSVLMSISRSSLSSVYFQDPLTFMPERWMREGSNGQEERTTYNKKESAFAFLPFGHGARSCVGRRFAEMEIYVATAKFLQNFEIRVDASYPALDICYTPFITPTHPIPFIFTARKQ